MKELCGSFNLNGGIAMDAKQFIRDPNHDKPIDILLVEDDLEDVKLTFIAFEEAKVNNNFIVVNDGREALDYVYHQGNFKDKGKYPKPDLILLDINMPKMNGFEVLKTLKGDEFYKTIPIIMLTSSRNEEDIIKSYHDGAVSYIPKPINFQEFVDIAKSFHFYWTSTSRLPNKE